MSNLQLNTRAMSTSDHKITWKEGGDIVALYYDELDKYNDWTCKHAIYESLYNQSKQEAFIKLLKRMEERTGLQLLKQKVA